MRRDVAWWGAVILSLLTAGFLPAAAGASELIGRDATGVGLRVDAAGRAAVSFRSEGQSRVVVAWGAVNARNPTRGQPQLAFRLQIGGPRGRHGAGNGTRYRATVIGPGVTPDVMWQGPAPAPCDPAADAQANAAQREFLANDRRCVVN